MRHCADDKTTVQKNHDNVDKSILQGSHDQDITSVASRRLFDIRCEFIIKKIVSYHKCWYALKLSMTEGEGSKGGYQGVEETKGANCCRKANQRLSKRLPSWKANKKNKKVLTRDVRRLGRDVRFYKTHTHKENDVVI